MCTILLLRDVHPNWPLVVAANRDEFYARATAGPQILVSEPPVFGGRDLQAGGTWLGVTPQGFFAAVTNQRSAVALGSAPRSRGELVLETLKRGTVDTALAWLREQSPEEFNPFNLVFGDSDAVLIAYGRETWAFENVPVGISVLPNDRLNSPEFPKVDRARTLCSQLPRDADSFLVGLQAVLADGEVPDTFPIQDGPLPLEIQKRLHALHVTTPAYGTRSSTIIAFQRGRVDQYLHADDVDDSAFRTYALPFGELGHVV